MPDSSTPIEVQAHLHHQYFLGLQLMVSVEEGKDVIGEWIFRIFRQQHEDKFLSSFNKLGLEDLPDAVACAKYHVLSNSVGGVRVEYMAESDTKSWVRFRYPQTLPTARQVHFLGDSHTFRTRPHRRRNLAKSIARKISREDPIDLCRQLRGTGREQRTLLATPASVLGEHLSRRFSRDRFDMERFHDSDQTALPCSPQSRFRQTCDRGATEQGTSISRLIGREDLPVRS